LDRWLQPETTSEPSSWPEGLLGTSESNDRLRTALTRLSTRQQEVMHLVFYQDLTIEEAAGLLNISLGSARTHFERGKARLRDLIKGTTV
jgi:RNA polymerase sigma-70 factor (ECF subfamily)